MCELRKSIQENGIHYTLHGDYYFPDLISAAGGADAAGRRRDRGIESPRSHGMGWQDERDCSPGQRDCHGGMGEPITDMAGTCFGGCLPCFVEALNFTFPGSNTIPELKRKRCLFGYVL